MPQAVFSQLGRPEPDCNRHHIFVIDFDLYVQEEPRIVLFARVVILNSSHYPQEHKWRNINREINFVDTIHCNA